MALDVDAIMNRVRLEVARRLLAAGLALQSAHRTDLSVGNPSPHNTPAPRGDFPRLRTGNLRANVVLATTSLAEIAKTGSLAIGYRVNGIYGMFLKARGWKGLLDTYDRERGRIAGILKNGVP